MLITEEGETLVAGEFKYTFRIFNLEEWLDLEIKNFLHVYYEC